MVALLFLLALQDETPTIADHSIERVAASIVERIRKRATVDPLAAMKDLTDLESRHPARLIEDGTSVVGIPDFRRRLVASLPASARDEIRTAADVEAAGLWRRWKADGDEAALREILLRHPLSSGAIVALDHFAGIAWDRGDAGAAAFFWSRLLAEPQETIAREVVAARLAQALAVSGRRDEIRALVDDPRLADKTLIVGRAQVAVVDYLKGLLRPPAPDAGTGPACTALLRASEAMPLREIDLPPESIAVPAFAGSIAVLSLPEEVIAISLAGELPVLWRSKDENVTIPSRRAPLGTSIGGDLVFATRMGAGPAPCTLRAMKLSDGSTAWEVGLDFWREQLKIVRNVVISPPALFDGLVIVAINEFDGKSVETARVVALRAETGAVVWIRDLGTAIGPSVPAMTLHGGRLYVSTNLGAVAAVDAFNGQVAWLRSYPRRAVRPRRRVETQMEPPPVPHEVSRPVIVGGRVWLAPTDSDELGIFDLATGGRISLQGAEVLPMSVASVGGKVALFGMRSVRLLDPTTGMAEIIETEAGRVRRVAASGAFIFMVMETRSGPRLLRIDAAERRVVEGIDVTFDGDSSLLVCGSRVLLAGRRVQLFGTPDAVARVAQELKAGSPVSMPDLLLSADVLWKSGRCDEGRDLYLVYLDRAKGRGDCAAGVVKARSVLAAQSLDRLRASTSNSSRVEWARSVLMWADTARVRVEANSSLAESLPATSPGEILVATLAVLRDTTDEVGESEVMSRLRRRALGSLWKLRKENPAVGAAADLFAELERLTADDAGSFLRIAATHPGSAVSVEAFIEAARRAGGLDARTLVERIYEIEGRLVPADRARLAEALERSVDEVEEGNRAVRQLIEWLKR